MTLPMMGDDLTYEGDDYRYRGDDLTYGGDDLTYGGDDLTYIALLKSTLAAIQHDASTAHRSLLDLHQGLSPSLQVLFYPIICNNEEETLYYT